mmetsp:Transcript_24168/g.50396  ORF Transcript_24168/g.50396 Transcript_24168/m.50396 type:complete len:300 (+) Transcript_24168:837-1736(+)
MVHVSSLVDNERRLSTKLKGNTLQVVALGGALHDLATDTGASSESNLVKSLVSCDNLSSLVVSWENVDSSGGESSLQNKLTDAVSSERGLGSSLQYNSATSRKGGAELPGLHEQGEVPRDDLTDNSNGLPLQVTKVTLGDRAGGIDDLARNLISPAGVVPVALDREGKIKVDGLRVRLSIVEHLKHGKLVSVLLHEIGQPVHENSTLVAAHLRPLAVGVVEGIASGMHCGIDLVNSGRFECRDDLLGRWIDRSDGIATIKPLVSDKRASVWEGERRSSKIGGNCREGGRTLSYEGANHG